VLNRQHTFRSQMQQLGRLVAAETQIVMLIATLPPSEEEELFRRMHFNSEQVKMFRALTARTNVAYRVVKVGQRVKKQEVEATVLAMVRRKLRKYMAGKVVVYGNSVPKVKALAEKLECQAYHHDAVGKTSMLEAFMAGRQRYLDRREVEWAEREELEERCDFCQGGEAEEAEEGEAAAARVCRR
jgi:superfamily II DNA helicase RecQ